DRERQIRERKDAAEFDSHIFDRQERHGFCPSPWDRGKKVVAGVETGGSLSAMFSTSSVRAGGGLGVSGGRPEFFSPQAWLRRVTDAPLLSGRLTMED